MPILGLSVNVWCLFVLLLIVVIVLGEAEADREAKAGMPEKLEGLQRDQLMLPFFPTRDCLQPPEILDPASLKPERRAHAEKCQFCGVLLRLAEKRD